MRGVMGWDAVVSLGIAKTENPVLVVVFCVMGFADDNFSSSLIFFVVYLFVILKKRSIITKLIPLQLRFNVSAE